MERAIIAAAWPALAGVHRQGLAGVAAADDDKVEIFDGVLATCVMVMLLDLTFLAAYRYRTRRLETVSSALSATDLGPVADS